MYEEKKNTLSRALTLAKSKGAVTVTNDKGLAGALARKDTTTALTAAGAPKRADLATVQKATAQSQTTTETVARDKRQQQNGICFVIDATGSRSATWTRAQETQSEMFDALKSVGSPAIGIVCHKREHVQLLGWFNSADQAKSAMADISCASGQTRIIGSLQAAIAPREGAVPSSIIMVGDCYEEYENDLISIAESLKKSDIKVYAFLEGDNPRGHWAYKYLAEATGGIFKRFGENLDIDLKDICVAAAVFDTGGITAFDRLLANGHKGAVALSNDVKFKQLGFKGPSR